MSSGCSPVTPTSYAACSPVSTMAASTSRRALATTSSMRWRISVSRRTTSASGLSSSTRTRMWRARVWRTGTPASLPSPRDSHMTKSPADTIVLTVVFGSPGANMPRTGARNWSTM